MLITVGSEVLHGILTHVYIGVDVGFDRRLNLSRGHLKEKSVLHNAGVIDDDACAFFLVE